MEIGLFKKSKFLKNTLSPLPFSIRVSRKLKSSKSDATSKSSSKEDASDKCTTLYPSILFKILIKYET
ncbi:hypothetical protein D3C71_1619490 [compost metagenome]